MGILGLVAFYALAVTVGWAIGVLIAEWEERRRRRRLDGREAKLQAEWRALLTAQRLNVAFIEARRAMWEEAIRQRRRPDAL